MSTPNNDVKSSKPGFSYARAAQGTSTAPKQGAASPQLNGKHAQATNDTSTMTAKTPLDRNDPPTDTSEVSQPTTTKPSATSAASGQPAWTSKGSGVHMPPRAVPATVNTTNTVRFGNFANEANPASQSSPTEPKISSAASGGTAPPSTIRIKDVPQFGTVPAANAAAESNLPGHSRTNSNASEFRPATMSPIPQGQLPYPQAAPFAHSSPAMPNFRGRGGSAGQFQGRGGARNVQATRNTSQSPLNSPQPQHVMPPYSNYMPPPQMYQGYSGYPPQYSYQGQNFHNQHMNQGYLNPQPSRGPMGFNNQSHQYQNPNLQAPTASSMSRSGSTASERPASGMNSGPQNMGTPTPSSVAPAFTTPRKKGSSAIKIVDPNSKNEVVLPRGSATPSAEVKRETVASPAPATIERPLSSGPARPAVSASPANAETPEQRKAKQDATRKAILDKIAAAKAAEQAEADKKAQEDKVAADADAAKKQAAIQAKEAEEKAQLAAEAAQAEKEKAKAAAVEEARVAEEKEKKIKQDAEAKAAIEAEERKSQAAAAAAAEEQETSRKQKLAIEEAETARAAEEKEAAAEDKPLNTIPEVSQAGQVEDVIETKTVKDSSDIADEPPASSEDVSADTTSKKTKSSGNSAADAPEKAAVSAMTSALQASKKITDLHAIAYPNGTNAPLTELNKNVKDGRYRYDKEFLLQFQTVFVDKPTHDWDDVIKSAMKDADSKSGKSMGGRSGSNRTNASPFSTLPSFNPKPLKSSDERFQQSEKMRAAGIDPTAALSGGALFERGSNFKPSVSRKDSAPSTARTESKKGGKGGRITSNRPEKPQIGAPTIAPEDVKPLAASGNRWTPKRAVETEPLPGGESTAMAPDMVQRKVKGLLNKLTLDNFDRITDQILEIASQSKDEVDGRTLRQVIALTFEKATDEAHFSNMYARFCRKMMECTSDDVKDEGIMDKHGQRVVGGTLFRKYLLSRCQEDFERGWKTELPPKPDGEPETEEAAMLSDEYYVAAAAKRRGLGLVRFVGELFLLQMLNEKIMQECITKLLANVVDPAEEEVESLTKLVETVGSALDSTERGRHVMNVYMDRMKPLTTCESLSSRIQFMVLDVLDLRRAGWVGSKTDKGPKTIQQIHDDAAQAAALKEAQRGSSHRGGMGGGGGPRPDFGRGDARNMSRRQESHGPSLTTGADGWSTLKASAARDTRAGDLTKFGKFGDKRTASQQSSFGPGGNLSQATRTNSNMVSRNPSQSGLSRDESRASQIPSNPFAALDADNAEGGDTAAAAAAESITESSQGRPRLNLLPKGATDGTENVAETQTAADESAPSPDKQSDTEESEAIPMPGDE